MTNPDPLTPHPTIVDEVPASRPPSLVHPGWALDFPWLVQGTTTRGASGSPFDLRLFGVDVDDAAAEARWAELLAATGAHRARHARQVHGRGVSVHGDGPAGLRLVDDCDAHVTDRPGVLLAVTTADCVPVFVVDPRRRAVAVAHAGWRGAAAGVVEASIAELAGTVASDPSELHVHLGPAICGACYEVGPEVFAALDQPPPSRPRPIDLRRILAERVRALGVPATNTSISSHCTRCTESGLFSHRAGDRERQVGFIAIRARGEGRAA